MDLFKINLHVHSNFSDGTNTIEQIVIKGIELGITYLSITDHLSNSWKSNVIPTLDSSAKIDNYLSEITRINHYLKNIDAKLRVLKGIEIDIGSDMEYIIKLINPNKFDLILFEYIENYEGLAFVSNIINYWRSSSTSKHKITLFGVAHLNPIHFYYGKFNRLIDFFTTYRLIYEFNASYPDSYSPKYKELFQRLKDHQIYFSIGSDSHNIESLSDIESPLRMIDYYDLQKNYKQLIRELDNLVF